MSTRQSVTLYLYTSGSSGADNSGAAWLACFSTHGTKWAPSWHHAAHRASLSSLADASPPGHWMASCAKSQLPLVGFPSVLYSWRFCELSLQVRNATWPETFSTVLACGRSWLDFFLRWASCQGPCPSDRYSFVKGAKTQSPAQERGLLSKTTLKG